MRSHHPPVVVQANLFCSEMLLLLLLLQQFRFGNKRPGLSGRPPCKGVAIGVARRGGRLSGERALRVPPCCSFPVNHPGGPHVASFVVGHRSCVHGACVRAGVARHAAKSVRAGWRGEACREKEKRRVPAKEGQKPKTRKMRCRSATLKALRKQPDRAEERARIPRWLDFSSRKLIRLRRCAIENGKILRF